MPKYKNREIKLQYKIIYLKKIELFQIEDLIVLRK